jgi:hypothetical protein
MPLNNNNNNTWTKTGRTRGAGHISLSEEIRGAYKMLNRILKRCKPIGKANVE